MAPASLMPRPLGRLALDLAGRMARPLCRLALALGGTLLCASLAQAAPDQVSLAAAGRFDLLEQQLEAQAGVRPLDSRDRHALCYAYSKTKRYGKLLACLDAWEQVLQGEDRRTRLFGLDDGTPALLLMRAETLLELGQYERSASSAAAALDWLKREDSEDLDMVFNGLATLGIAQQGLGRSADAAATRARLQGLPAGLLSPYRSAKAMALARLAMAAGDDAGVLKALEGDRLFSAEIFLDRLFSGAYLTGQDNWMWVELPRLFMLAKALHGSGRTAQARATYDRLLALPEARLNGDIHWLLLDQRAQLAQQEGQPEAALALSRQAIDVVEKQRATVQSELNKIGFFADKQGLYGRAVQLAVGAGQAELAFDLIEGAKARALLDLLAARSLAERTGTRAGQAAPLMALDLAAQDQRFAQLPLAAGKGLGDFQPVALLRTGGPLPAATATGLAAPGAPPAAPATALPVPGSDPTSAVAARVPVARLRELIGTDECLVEFFVHGREVTVVAVTDHQTAAVRLSVPDLEQQVRALRVAIRDRTEGTVALARQLYDVLLKPVQQQLGGRDLLIVPHGPLHYLPFAALRDEAGWLIERRALRFLPSSSSQAYLRSPTAGDARPTLILGNPDLGDPDLDLPGAQTEADAVAAVMQPARSFTRREATETLFKQQAAGYRHIHLAAHGQYREDQPLLSRLALARDAHNDGDLHAAELFGLRLEADLVTLSACETGLGKALSGDEVIGLQRGFLYAGASNILASLWEVDDQATAALMRHFYPAWRSGMPVRQALRSAQQAVARTFPEPVYWAAFQVTGLGR